MCGSGLTDIASNQSGEFQAHLSAGLPIRLATKPELIRAALLPAEEAEHACGGQPVCQRVGLPVRARFLQLAQQPRQRRRVVEGNASGGVLGECGDLLMLLRRARLPQLLQ